MTAEADNRNNNTTYNKERMSGEALRGLGWKTGERGNGPSHPEKGNRMGSLP